jgi:ribosomal protein S18 acetylase RimI-like enzyme
MKPEITIRPATMLDYDFIVSLAPRFAEFGPPAWRDPTHIIALTAQFLKQALEAKSDDNLIFLAEDEMGASLGFIRLQTERDFFSGQAFGYIADVAVSRTAESRGVGRRLMAVAESWAIDCGFDILALHVFAHNERVCRFYEALGYQQDVIRYVKSVNLAAADSH